jgi:hypothetical protein
MIRNSSYPEFVPRPIRSSPSVSEGLLLFVMISSFRCAARFYSTTFMRRKKTPLRVWFSCCPSCQVPWWHLRRRFSDRGELTLQEDSSPLRQTERVEWVLLGMPGNVYTLPLSSRYVLGPSKLELWVGFQSECHMNVAQLAN